MAANPELQTLCKQYLSINLVYCCGIFLQTYGQRLLQAVGDIVLSMISLIIGAILNIILDPIMIFGLFGCPAMGIRGAAIATVIRQMVGAIAALLFNRFCKPGNADSRYSGTANHLRFLCYGCNYNPVRIFCFRTRKRHH